MKMTSILQNLMLNINVQTILVGVVVILFVFKLRQRMKYKLPPGPFAWPLIGNLEVMNAKLMFEKFADYKRKYGPVFQIFLGPVRVVVLSDIKVVTEAMITQKADFANRPQVTSVHMLTQGGKDIAFSNYTPTWKLQRKVAGKALRQYMAGSHLEEVVHRSMEKCLKKMASHKEPFDPELDIDLMIFTFLNDVLFDKSADLDDPEFYRIMELDKQFNDLFGKGLIEDMFPFLIKIRPTEKYKRFEAWCNELINIFQRRFKEHQETFDPDNIRDYTDMLLKSRKEAEGEENVEMLSQLTDTRLFQTVFDIFFAGIDTSRVTLYFALRYLAVLPEVQRKVQTEIDKVVGKDRLPGLKDRENLSYGNATLHEIMRLGTVVPLGLPHETLCDTQVGGYDVPKGTMVMIDHWALHHDTDYWPDVNKFDPTRYLDDGGKLDRKPESWLPFSMGRRVCLGETVAKPELHLIFSSIFQRFNVSLDTEGDSNVQYTGTDALLQPSTFKIRITERM